MWPFNKKASKIEAETLNSNEVARNDKLLQSQLALIEAAKTTTQMANYVTITLKNKLDDSIEQLDSTAKILYDALIITDADGSIQAFNPAAERMFGKTCEQAKNKFFGELIYSTSREFQAGCDIWDLFKQIDQAEEADDLFGSKGMTKFKIDINHTVLERSDGSIIVLMVIKKLMDFETEFKKHIGYKSIFDSFDDGIIVIKNQKIVAANSSSSKILGFPIEELLSKTMEEITSQAVDEKSGMIDMSFTSSSITWDEEDAILLTIRDLSNVIQDAKNMICCFGADFKLTFVNAQFSQVYGAKQGDDVRSILPDDERHAMLINISKLTNTESARTIRLHTSAKIQMWTDYFSEIDGVIEYQRVGKIF